MCLDLGLRYVLQLGLRNGLERLGFESSYVSKKIQLVTQLLFLKIGSSLSADCLLPIGVVPQCYQMQVEVLTLKRLKRNLLESFCPHYTGDGDNVIPTEITCRAQSQFMRNDFFPSIFIRSQAGN